MRRGDKISFTSYSGERQLGTFIGECSADGQTLFLVAVPDKARLIKVAATACWRPDPRSETGTRDEDNTFNKFLLGMLLMAVGVALFAWYLAKALPPF